MNLSVLARSADPVFAVGTNGAIAFWNEAAERTFGYRAAQVVGRPCWTVIGGCDENAHRVCRTDCHVRRRTRADELPARFVFSTADRDGRELWFDVSFIVVREASPSDMLILHVLRDVTEQRTLEKERAVLLAELGRRVAALEESEARYRLLAENISDVIWVRDLADGATYVSPSIERQTGYTAAEALDRSLADMLAPPSLELALTTIAHEVAREPESPPGTDPHTLELEVRRKDGSTYWTETTMTFVHDRRDRPPRILGVTRDISARRRAEQEKAAVEEQLRQAQKMDAVGRLAGGIAHDFNNVLTVILGRTEFLLARETLDQRARRDVELTRRTAERAAALTRQLLAFSRRQLMRPRVVDVNAIIAGLTPMLQRLIGEDIELSVVPTEDLGRVLVDESQLEQVVLNLVVNARDAMPTGGRITIETANVELDGAVLRHAEAVSPGPYVALIVTDTGTGMDADTRSKIFEPFFTTKPTGQGTGLGLSTVFGIVKQSGGHVSVYTELGMGSTFRVYLPRTDAPPESGGHAGGTVSVAGTETVLLVEDDPEVRAVARDALLHYGYVVLTATGRDEAVEIARQHAGVIDLLLTDVVMPHMTGPELASEIRALRRGLTVVYMSGYTDSEMSRRAILSPGARFIEKPFTPATFVARVREALAERSS